MREMFYKIFFKVTLLFFQLVRVVRALQELPALMVVEEEQQLGLCEEHAILLCYTLDQSQMQFAMFYLPASYHLFAQCNSTRTKRRNWKYFRSDRE